MLQCFRATTHSDLVLRAGQKGVEYRVIHNSSMFQSYYSHRPGTEGSTEGCRIQGYTYRFNVSELLLTQTWY